MRHGLALALWVILLAPAAAAAPSALELTGRFPLALSGQGTAHASEAQALLEGNAGALELALDDLEAEALHVVHRVALHTPEGGLPMVVRDQVEKRTLDLDRATVRLVDRQADFLLFVFEAQAALGSLPAGSLGIEALREPRQVLQGFDAPPSTAASVQTSAPDGDNGTFAWAIAAGHHAAQTAAGHLASDGAFQVVLSGGRVSVAQPGQADEVLNLANRTVVAPGGLYNPATGTWFGPGTHTEILQEHLVLDARQGRLRASFDAVPAMLFGGRMALAGAGELRVPGARGTITVHDEKGTSLFTPDRQDLVLTGRYDLLLDRVDGSGTARLSGSADLTGVHFGPVSERFSWGLVTAGFGALAFGLLAWAAAKGKLVGSSAGLLAAYARLHGERVLRHPARLEAYDLVKASAGITLPEISRRMGLNSSTLRHHLRSLVASGYLSQLQDGGSLRYFDGKDPAYAGRRKHAVSALHNANTAAIARHIRDHPGASQKDLTQRFALAQGTVRWHVDRLQAVGLVRAQRDPPFVRYFPAEALPPPSVALASGAAVPAGRRPIATA